jgi:hypothetical protein
VVLAEAEELESLLELLTATFGSALDVIAAELPLA